MKKVIFIILILSGIVAIAYYIYTTKTQAPSNNYEAEKTAVSKNNTEENPQSNESPPPPQEQETPSQQNDPQPPVPTEAEELATFSTKIHTKDSSRQNNVTITCSTLNDTDVAPGEEFSFCNTVGRASPSKGYKKAEIFTNGKKTQGYGGGNCQVSTTLYNAVLAVPDLTVTERHSHSNKVPYIQNGKDAAVAYGSYDFKFVNNTGNSVRIKANNTDDSVNIRLIKLI